MEFPIVGEKRAAPKGGAAAATASSAADPKQPKHTTTEASDAPAPFPVGSYASVALEPGLGVRGKEEGGLRGDVMSFNAAKGTCVVKQEGQIKGRGITFATSRLSSASRSFMADLVGRSGKAPLSLKRSANEVKRKKQDAEWQQQQAKRTVEKGAEQAEQEVKAAREGQAAAEDEAASVKKEEAPIFRGDPSEGHLTRKGLASAAAYLLMFLRGGAWGGTWACLAVQLLFLAPVVCPPPFTLLNDPI